MAKKKGGKQPGSGRPRGSLNKSTLEQRKVSEAFNQRVLRAADALFNAQLTLAIGSMKVFRIDEIAEGAKTKREHVHVTDADEIKALLDVHEGSPGIVEGKFYYFSAVLPDNKAIDSLLNRGLGKPVEKREHSFDLSNLTDEELKLLESVTGKLTQS